MEDSYVGHMIWLTNEKPSRPSFGCTLNLAYLSEPQTMLALSSFLRDAQFLSQFSVTVI